MPLQLGFLFLFFLIDHSVGSVSQFVVDQIVQGQYATNQSCNVHGHVVIVGFDNQRLNQVGFLQVGQQVLDPL